jgi:magnesium chelatase family protein
LDRIDLFVEVPRVDYEKLSAEGSGERSETIRDRVRDARERQQHRFSETRFLYNAEMSPTEVRTHCQARLDEQAQSLLRVAMAQLTLSARSFHRILKVARTIADLDHSDAIVAHHLAEAVQYRHRN